ncbi:hypothetical protein GYMLUDRAFT_763657 [Collybiopsis luxurians FD-317 M1]|uniref:Uncharacterized protein n=1 Tax=Collybiopsis luxurians FD-317 M1 TaxID=944289 RepID=A0A0D0BQ24_9AGAR|nr:hypothetical protein GYMLUDRAFT_763657 [Collybiopsis luxurians FD-317 M1]
MSSGWTSFSFRHVRVTASVLCLPACLPFYLPFFPYDDDYLFFRGPPGLACLEVFSLPLPCSPHLLLFNLTLLVLSDHSNLDSLSYAHAHMHTDTH